MLVEILVSSFADWAFRLMFFAFVSLHWMWSLDCLLYYAVSLLIWSSELIVNYLYLWISEQKIFSLYFLCIFIAFRSGMFFTSSRFDYSWNYLLCYALSILIWSIEWSVLLLLMKLGIVYFVMSHFFAFPVWILRLASIIYLQYLCENRCYLHGSR